VRLLRKAQFDHSVKEPFSRPGLVASSQWQPEMLLDRKLAVMVDHKNVVAFQLLVDHASQDRLVVWQKLYFAFLLIKEVMLLRVSDCLVLFTDNLYQSC